MLEVARYFHEKKDDRPQATRFYEEGLLLVPDSLDAAKPLADIYIAAENWEAGERMLDIVTQKMSERLAMGQEGDSARELCRQYYRLGYVSEKTTHKDKALKAYEKAYQLDATYLPALEGLGNLLVHAKRFDEAQKVYQTILLHHKDDLTDLEVVEIYWTLGDIAVQQKQLDRGQNHFEKALSIDPAHEPSLRSQVAISEQQNKWDKAAQYRLSLLTVVDGDDKYEVAMALGKLAREKLHDAHMAIDAYQAAHKIKANALDVLDALYVLYRETKQPQKAADILEQMLAEPELKKDVQRGKRVWYALGEICRDELKDLDKAAHSFNAALDLDYKFLEAFSALEAMQGRHKLWKPLEQNYVRMIQRLPKGDETHGARMAMWKALGDLYLKVLKQPEAAVQAYQVVAAASPDDAAVQETYAELASQQPGLEEKAVDAWRRALPATANPGKIAKALMELAAKRKDYDSAWLAAQVSTGLIGSAGDGEREILSKLNPYAKKKEQAQRPLTDRLWHQHLFHPKVRGPMAEMMGLLFEQVGHVYKQELAQYHINPKKHLIDVSSAQEYQIHHFRYVSRLLGMEQVAIFSPFLVGTREKMAKRTSDPAPEPMVGIEICHTHPVCLKVGGKFFSETGTKEVYYMLGRALALLRPELALSQRLSAERLEAVFQAAISLSVDTFRWSADKAAIEAERRTLEKTLTESARGALARVTKEYVKRAGPNDLRNYLEGAELSAVRTGLFVAGEIEPVKKMVMGEQGSAQRVPARSKLNDLLVFALGDDLHALRVAVGTQVEVQLRK
jgi:tetratricopeptide (TPR) repeat protein